MDKEQRDREIDRLVDISVAEENARLMAGGASVGDEVPSNLTALGVQRRREGTLGNETAAVPQPIQLESSEPPYRDDYREIIEAEAPPEDSKSQIQDSTAPGQPAAMTPAVEARVEEIRGRVMSYPADVRVDVGFLLTVIDAINYGYATGRL